MGDESPKFTVGDGYITIPQYGWLTGHNRYTYTGWPKKSKPLSTIIIKSY